MFERIVHKVLLRGPTSSIAVEVKNKFIKSSQSRTESEIQNNLDNITTSMPDPTSANQTILFLIYSSDHFFKAKLMSLIKLYINVHLDLGT